MGQYSVNSVVNGLTVWEIRTEYNSHEPTTEIVLLFLYD